MGNNAYRITIIYEIYTLYWRMLQLKVEIIIEQYIFKW